MACNKRPFRGVGGVETSGVETSVVISDIEGRQLEVCANQLLYGSSYCKLIVYEEDKNVTHAC